MKVPEDLDVRIIVVENDSEPYEQQLIEGVAATSRFDIEYHLETRIGISSARNRSVREAKDAAYCCFVDDDQCVDAEWLTELFKCQREFRSAGVCGQSPPVFKRKVPPFVRSFHEPELYNYGTVVERAYTGCLLLSRQWIDKTKGPFNEKLNFTGGEDCSLTSRITKLGGEIRFTPYAKAYENIPDGRTTILYILRRTFRTANARYYYRSLEDENFSKYTVIPRMIMRLCYGFLSAVPFLFVKADRLKGILKMVDGLGGLMFFLGVKNSFYR